MVFFTCGHCGESIKKPQIAKHYSTKCRAVPNLTCVDCLKEFRGNEYEAHIKCITEEERYSAKGFVAKATSNKGEKKQQSWCESMQSLLNSDVQLKADERELITALSSHENVPRKRVKFMNFLGSAYRAYARNKNLTERVWNIIEQHCKNANASTEQQPAATEEPKTENETTTPEEADPQKSSKKGKKRKTVDDIKQNGECEQNGHGDEKPSKKKKKDKNSEKDESSPTANEIIAVNGEMTNGKKKKDKKPKVDDTKEEKIEEENISDKKKKKKSKTESGEKESEVTEMNIDGEVADVPSGKKKDKKAKSEVVKEAIQNCGMKLELRDAEGSDSFEILNNFLEDHDGRLTLFDFIRDWKPYFETVKRANGEKEKAIAKEFKKIQKNIFVKF